MKVIFDENVPEPLRQFLAHHEVTTVQQQGWSGIGNGQLLQRVDRTFDVLLLADKNLRYQQNLSNRQIALVELPTNRWHSYKRSPNGLSLRSIRHVRADTRLSSCNQVHSHSSLSLVTIRLSAFQDFSVSDFEKTSDLRIPAFQRLTVAPDS